MFPLFRMAPHGKKLKKTRKLLRKTVGTGADEINNLRKLRKFVIYTGHLDNECVWV